MQGTMSTRSLDAQRHFTLRQIASDKLGNPQLYHTVRRWFQNEPGVINAGSGKRNRFLLIPEDVADRVIETKKLIHARR
jgi:hypothetical protein